MISPFATGRSLAMMVTGSSCLESSSMTAPRPIRRSWCIGMTERPRTTEISTLTPLMFEDMKRPMHDRPDPRALMGWETLMPPVEWRVESRLTAYPDAVAFMEERAAAIAEHRARELVWLGEHPPIYTAGTSADQADLIDARFPVFKTGRGGQFTYHGPGQRVGYVMLDLKRRKTVVRGFVRDLEEWMIRTLARFAV